MVAKVDIISVRGLFSVRLCLLEDRFDEDSSLVDILMNPLVLQLLSESLDVIQNSYWTTGLGNAFASNYELYSGDHCHSALLHR